MNIHEKALIGFGRASDSYERGRPEYPLKALEFLVQKFSLGPDSHIVDLGAGTGKWTKSLVETGAVITAVEPVKGMRNKFQALFPQVTLVNGSAEMMPLPSVSADVVFVAQAFHWFQGPRALEEIHRVLKPQGHLVLLWNVRDESLDWMKQLNRLMEPHRDQTPQYASMKWCDAFDGTSLFSRLELKQFAHNYKGTVNNVLDRFESVSFISSLPEGKRIQFLTQVKDFLETHPQTKEQKQIEMPYRTDVYWCRKWSQV